jgi:hypothetical protein
MRKHVYAAFGLLFGLAVGYGIATFESAPFVVHGQAGTPFMCSNGGSVPNGYVVVGESPNNNCVGPNGTSGNMYQLLKLKANPDGSMGAVICTGTTVPSGFVTVGWNHNPNTCVYPGAPNGNQQSIALYN